MSSVDKKTKTPVKWLPGVVISFVLILMFVFLIDWGEFKGSLVAISPSVILLMVLLTILPLTTRSLAWRSLLDRQVTFRDAFFGENIGYLSNNLLPFRIGEIARGILLAEKVSGGFAAVLPSIFVERLIDISYAALTLLIAIPFVVSESWMIPTVLLSLVVVVVGFLFLFISLKKSELIERWIHSLLRKIPTVEKWMTDLYKQFLHGLKTASDNNNILRAAILLGFTWIFYWLSYYVLIRAVVPEAHFIWALFTDGVVSLGIAIPSAPGSLGVWEASFVAALAVFGIEQSKSLAVGVVMHLISYAVTGFFGIIGFGVFGSSFTNLLHRVKEQRQKISDSRTGEQ